MKPLRVGLVGYGYAGKTFHVPLIRSIQGLSLYAVASSAADRVRGELGDVKLYRDAETMIHNAGIDLVVIASPNVTHVPLAKLAIAAGHHVVVEKPLAPTVTEARDLVELADRHAVSLSVFHNRRWDSDFCGVQDAIASGKLGRIVHFESRIERFRPAIRKRWREMPLPGSGLWYDLGPHLVDQALQLFGMPDRVLASFACQRDESVVEDWAHVVLEYEQLRCILHCSMLGTEAPRFLVQGTSGRAVKRHGDRQETQLVDNIAPGSADWGSDPDPLVLIDADDRRVERMVFGDQRIFYARLLEHLRGRGSNPVSGAAALSVAIVLEAAARSAASGRSELAIGCDPEASSPAEDQPK